jgi:hypothetical protein
MPIHMRPASASDGGRVIPGFMRYRDSNGATVYDSHYLPQSSSNKGHWRGASAYSLADSESEGATLTGLYDPPSAGLRGSKYEGPLDSEEGYKDDDYEEREYRDHDRDSVLTLPPGLEPSGGTVEAIRGNAPESLR